MRWILCFGLILSNMAHGQEGSNDAVDTSDFRRRVEILNDRYEDFFAHDERSRRFSERVMAGTSELKSERRTNEREREQARKQQVANRRRKPDTTPLEREEERIKAAQARVQDRLRRDYIRQREQLRRISNSARKIPENRDAGLE